MKKGNYYYIALYANTLIGEVLMITSESEKAIQVKNDDMPYTLWIPKSAIEKIPNRTDAYCIKKWFLKNITEAAWKRNIFGC